MERLVSHLETEERYPALRFVGMTFTAIGAVMLVIGSLTVAFGLHSIAAGPTGGPPQQAAPGPFNPMTPAVIPVPAGLSGGVAILFSLGFLVSGVQFVAMGALTRLAIHVEENTRATAQGLEKLAARIDVDNPRFVS